MAFVALPTVRPNLLDAKVAGNAKGPLKADIAASDATPPNCNFLIFPPILCLPILSTAFFSSTLGLGAIVALAFLGSQPSS